MHGNIVTSQIHIIGWMFAASTALRAERLEELEVCCTRKYMFKML